MEIAAYKKAFMPITFGLFGILLLCVAIGISSPSRANVTLNSLVGGDWQIKLSSNGLLNRIYLSSDQDKPIISSSYVNFKVRSQLVNDRIGALTEQYH